MINKLFSTAPANVGFEGLSSALADVGADINAHLAANGWSLSEFKQELESVDIRIPLELMATWIDELVNLQPTGAARRYARTQGREAIAVANALLASDGLLNKPTVVNPDGNRQNINLMNSTPKATKIP